ncbi:hypothetical protein EUTSA_v10021119mg [Eutrema salsugineum]|uniref:Uncharacterized protein n=1 Tax=Eutrema salsugineum TaxID=72664 RepID=V4LGV6_EUTSA|nr:hypothetical protein EUTSA_v10021119mg [Eutrema salsugineum]
MEVRSMNLMETSKLLGMSKHLYIPSSFVMYVGADKNLLVKDHTHTFINKCSEIGGMSSVHYSITMMAYVIFGFHFLQSVLVTIDRHEWYAPPQLYTRNDSSGLWDVKPAIESIGNSGLPISQHIPLCHHDTEPLHEVNLRGVNDTASIMEASSGDGSQNDFGSEAKKQRVEDGSLDGTINMLDLVHVPPSCSLDGVHSQHFFGTGVIIYHSSSMGLAVVYKNTVAISASDVMLSFAAFPVEIPGEVVFLYPVHNYALIAYNPSAMSPAGASVIRAAELLPGMSIQICTKAPLGFQLSAGCMMQAFQAFKVGDRIDVKLIEVSEFLRPYN